MVVQVVHSDLHHNMLPTIVTLLFANAQKDLTYLDAGLSKLILSLTLPLHHTLESRQVVHFSVVMQLHVDWWSYEQSHPSPHWYSEIIVVMYYTVMTYIST